MLKSGLTIARRLRSNGLNGVIGAEDVCSRFGKLHYTTAVGQSAINDDPKGKDASSSVPQFGPPEAYVSTSQSPLFNLSFEEHLLRTRPHNTPVCLIYRNSPCIVIGRNQNHWKELNIDEMRKRNLSLVRRRSGGGAVFHDLGNTNFSFHVPRLAFARRTHAELMARALNGHSIGLCTHNSHHGPTPPAASFKQGYGSPEGVYVNDRNDLVVRIAVAGADPSSTVWSERKISGSAFKILTHRAYHHGTTLLDADLSALGSALRNTKSSKMVSKGVESVKSGVVNLCDAYPEVASKGLLHHDAFTRAVIEEFWRTYSQIGRDEEDSQQAQISRQFTSIDESHQIAQEEKRVNLQKEIGQWDWIFGQCPEFETEFDLSGASQAVRQNLHDAGLAGARVWLRCRNGLIEEVEIRAADVTTDASVSHNSLREALASIKGQRYDQFTDIPPLPSTADVRKAQKPDVAGLALEVHKSALLAWLREAL